MGSFPYGVIRNQRSSGGRVGVMGWLLMDENRVCLSLHYNEKNVLMIFSIKENYHIFVPCIISAGKATIGNKATRSVRYP